MKKQLEKAKAKGGVEDEPDEDDGTNDEEIE